MYGYKRLKYNIVYPIDTICAGSKPVCTWVPPALSLVDAYVHWSALSIEHESAICNCYKYACTVYS